MREAFGRHRGRDPGQWDATNTGDTETRERLWMQRQMLLKVRDHLKAVMEGGELTRKRIVQIDQDRKFNAWRKAI
jgi:hypothetical protein